MGMERKDIDRIVLEHQGQVCGESCVPLPFGSAHDVDDNYRARVSSSGEHNDRESWKWGGYNDNNNNKRSFSYKGNCFSAIADFYAPLKCDQ